MNTVTAYVDKVLSEPYFINNKKKFGKNHRNWWAVDVRYSDMGGKRDKTLYFLNKEEAKKVEKGYKFTH